MAPELALAYVVGMVPSLAVTGMHAVKHRRKLRSSQYSLLQENLYSVGKYWSEVEGRILPFTEGSIQLEYAKLNRTLLIMGAAFCFLSWAGFIFNLIIYFSIHHLAVTRFEQKVFASELTKQRLSIDQINLEIAVVDET